MSKRLDKIKHNATFASFVAFGGKKAVTLSKEDYEYLITCIEAQQGCFATKDVIIMGDVNRIVNGVASHVDEKGVNNLLFSKNQMDKNRYLECLLKVSKKLEVSEKVTHSDILEIKTMINVELGKIQDDF